MDCDCEFDPYEDGDTTEESWHHKRTCRACGTVWWAVHCPHDAAQNPCPACGDLQGGQSAAAIVFPLTV